MPNTQFTQEDHFDPVYCSRCKAHVPRAELDTSGHCQCCREEIKQEHEEEAVINRALLKANDETVEERKQAIYKIDTNQGVCPHCGSRNIHVGLLSASRSSIAKGLTSVLIGRLPSDLLFGMQERKTCVACGHMWDS